MPPKKAPTTSKKTEVKKKEKVIEVKSTLWQNFCNEVNAESIFWSTGQNFRPEEQEGCQDAEVHPDGGEAGEVWWAASLGR